MGNEAHRRIFLSDSRTINKISFQTAKANGNLIDLGLKGSGLVGNEK
jgi:hypothetical protein